MSESSRVDQLREVRAKVASGALTEEEAARRLAVQSGGGLTESGAADLIRRRTSDVEAAWAREFRTAEQGIRRIRGEESP